MFLEIYLRVGEGDSRMSDRSKRLAVSVRKALQQAPSDEAMLQRNRILNDGWMRLRETLKGEFESQIEELRKADRGRFCALNQGLAFGSKSGDAEGHCDAVITT